MREIKLAALLLAILLTGCAASGSQHADVKGGVSSAAENAAPAQAAIISDSDAAQIQTIAFRPGVSSATVDRIAQRYGCKSVKGAALITDQGPVEVYRMACGDGTTFMARCELRQCRTMR